MWLLLADDDDDDDGTDCSSDLLMLEELGRLRSARSGELSATGRVPMGGLGTGVRKKVTFD